MLEIAEDEQKQDSSYTNDTKQALTKRVQQEIQLYLSSPILSRDQSPVQ